MEVSKQDWKLFREKLPDWQERYMEQLLKKYVAFLESEGLASDKFWELEKMIKKDKNTPGVQLRLDKKGMDYDLTKLMLSGAISLDDLKGFSDELIERVNSLSNYLGEK